MRADAKDNYDRLLAVARTVVTEQGADASLRDIARRAGVGLGTLYRHFPSRDALFDVLLRANLDELTQAAGELEKPGSPDEALMTWLRDAVAFTRSYNGVVDLMAAALADEDSALHASCTAVRAAGTRLLERAQATGLARSDLEGTELFALIAALAWLGDQPSFAPLRDRLFDFIVSAILTKPGKKDKRRPGRSRATRRRRH